MRPSDSNIELAQSVTPTTKDEGALHQRGPVPPSQPQESVGSAFATGFAAVDAQAHKYANGYHFPPKYPLKEQISMGLVSFWHFYNTGFGFFLTMYSLNVVAWGGMLFLLLCNAAPNMCYDGDCNHIDSPRRIWIETDSQILNALFCVTGFGLAPWRFRDLYFLLKYRIKGDLDALRALAGVHRGWFRLPGSDSLPAALGPKNVEEMADKFDHKSVPTPLDTIPDAPPTGIRAPPTRMWKMDFIVWNNIFNTIFQVILCAYMWSLDRYDRPSWSTGLFVCLGMLVAAIAGITMGTEGKHVKIIEGVPLTKGDLERLARDRELGIAHYNSYGGKEPKEKKKGKRSGRGKTQNTAEAQV
ncbi:DUF2985 domain-containing protein [Microdochium nivale]|nr:DUF2985 domain-containing protein [Microdochium nivale]